jgi:predicted PurR-regulated permease PerM
MDGGKKMISPYFIGVMGTLFALLFLGFLKMMFDEYIEEKIDDKIYEMEDRRRRFDELFAGRKK